MDLPSCSKSEESQMSGKVAVVVLTKLDPELITLKVSPDDWDILEQQKELANNGSTKASEKVAALGDGPQDGAASRSHVSAATQDKAQDKQNDKKSGVSAPARNVFEDIQQLNGSLPKSEQVTRSDKFRVLKRPPPPREIDKENSKKAKTEETLELVMHSQEQLTLNKADKNYNRNARYKISLSSFPASAVENESFKKFLNLATDCVLSFKRKFMGAPYMTGNVELYFGDFLSAQLAMERLMQLSVLAGKCSVEGSIICQEIRPAAKAGRWSPHFVAKLLFQFCADKTTKLQEIISDKGRIKEDTTSKCVQLNRIPSSVSQEMLSLLFPFSLAVKISKKASSDKDFKGPVEIKFDSKELAEAVLACFKNLRVTTSPKFDRLISLQILAADTGTDKAPESSADNKQKQATDTPKPGAGKVETNRGQAKKVISRPSHGSQVSAKSSTSKLPHNIGNVARKRRFDKPEDAGWAEKKENSAVKRSRIDVARDSRGPALRPDRIRRQGEPGRRAGGDRLNPTSPNVLAVLEMRARRGMAEQQIRDEIQNQTLALRQGAEAQRLLASMPSQELMLGLDEAVQARNMRIFNAELLQREERSRRDEAERIQQLEQEARYREELALREEMIKREERAKLEELSRREEVARREEVVRREEMTWREESERKQHRGSRHLPPRSEPRLQIQPVRKAARAQVFPFGAAPATRGLLGSAPPAGHLDDAGDEWPLSASSVQTKNQLQRKNVATASSRLKSEADRLKAKYSRMSQNIRERSQLPARPRERPQLQTNLDGNRRPRLQQSRWDEDRENTNNRRATARDVSFDPGLNDKPLDFSRPQPRLSAQEAFRQDTERTRAVLSQRMETVARSLPAILQQTLTQQQLGDSGDRISLPVQFGKNPPRKTPQELENEQRKLAQMQLNRRPQLDGSGRMADGGRDRAGQAGGNLTRPGLAPGSGPAFGQPYRQAAVGGQGVRGDQRPRNEGMGLLGTAPDQRGHRNTEVRGQVSYPTQDRGRPMAAPRRDKFQETAYPNQDQVRFSRETQGHAVASVRGEEDAGDEYYVDRTWPDIRSGNQGQSVDTSRDRTAGFQPKIGRGRTAGFQPETGRGMTAGFHPETDRGMTASFQPETFRGRTAGFQPETGRGMTAGFQPETGRGMTTGFQAGTGRGRTAGFQPETGRGRTTGFQPETGRDRTAGFQPERHQARSPVAVTNQLASGQARAFLPGPANAARGSRADTLARTGYASPGSRVETVARSGYPSAQVRQSAASSRQVLASGLGLLPLPADMNQQDVYFPQQHMGQGYSNQAGNQYADSDQSSWGRASRTNQNLVAQTAVRRGAVGRQGFHAGLRVDEDESLFF